MCWRQGAGWLGPGWRRQTDPAGERKTDRLQGTVGLAQPRTLSQPSKTSVISPNLGENTETSPRSQSWSTRDEGSRVSFQY